MFFSKKPKSPTARYIAYAHKMAKYRNVMTAIAASEGVTLLVYFFDQTANELRELSAALGLSLKTQGEYVSGNDVVLSSVFDLNGLEMGQYKEIVCIEVHPLASVNALVLNAVTNPQYTITYYLGMDEEVMRVFGIERIQGLLERMGVQEDEPIEHSMVTKSIIKRLEKQEQKLANPVDVRSSPADWFQANGGEKSI